MAVISNAVTTYATKAATGGSEHPKTFLRSSII